MVDVVVVISGIDVDGSPTLQGIPCTKVFRYEFETEEDAMNFLDTSNDPKGLVNVEPLDYDHKLRLMR